MKANELRLGNYATDNIQTGIITVFNNDTCVLKHKSGIVKCKVSNLNPIQLTKEWLLNFGFEYSKFHNNYYAKAGDYFNSISYDVEDCEWHYNNDKSDAECYYVASIKYVHQLQNLYFALTGEELIFKSE